MKESSVIMSKRPGGTDEYSMSCSQCYGYRAVSGLTVAHIYFTTRASVVSRTYVVDDATQRHGGLRNGRHVTGSTAGCRAHVAHKPW